ncbi:MAG: SRPBCC family protein [Pseudomonadota bacterium]
MPKTRAITRDYPVSAEILWADILDPAALAASMEGALTYEGLPSEPVFEGQVINVTIKRWGWWPMGKWTMKVVERDDEAYVLRSEEWGGPVKCYRHRLDVTPTGPESCQYTDHLDLDAGWLTPVVFPMFCKMYERRHEIRAARLAVR